MNDCVIRVDGLRKKFGQIVAVDGITFEVYRGEIFGLLGPNGAGKTTTIRMMSGLLKPDDGKIRINSTGNGRLTGICPQHIVIWENMTVLEQTVFMGRMYDMTPGEAKRRSGELLEALGLSSVRNRLAKRLSGGMQRRLNIALALIHTPAIVFLDEPQAGLDPQSRVLVRDYIRSIKAHTTVVLTTHDMEEAEKLSDRICIVDHGKVLACGTAPEIKRATGHEDLIEVEISGDVNAEFVPFIPEEIATGIAARDNLVSISVKEPVTGMEQVVKVIKARNLDVKILRLRKKSLEDIFIDLTGRSIRE